MKRQSIQGFLRLASLTTLAVVLALALTFAGASAPAAAQDTTPTALIKTGQLNMRDGPGPGYAVIRGLQYAEQVRLLGRTSDSGWAKVQTSDGTQGWASTLYLLTGVPLSSLPVLAQAEPWGLVITGTANMRTGAGLDFAIFTTLNLGTYVNIYARSEDSLWVYCRANGILGWLGRSTIGTGTLVGNLPTSLPGGFPTGSSSGTTTGGTTGTTTGGTTTGGTTTGGTTTGGTTTGTTTTGGTTGGTTGAGEGLVTGHIWALPKDSETPIPTLDIYAVNVATGAFVGTIFHDDCASGFACPSSPPTVWDFALAAPEGDYVVYAYRRFEPGGLWGAYTKNPTCGGTGTDEDHSLVIIHITAGATTSGIDLCDRWDPGFAYTPPEPHN